MALFHKEEYIGPQITITWIAVFALYIHCSLFDEPSMVIKLMSNCFTQQVELWQSNARNKQIFNVLRTTNNSTSAPCREAGSWGHDEGTSRQRRLLDVFWGYGAHKKVTQGAINTCLNRLAVPNEVWLGLVGVPGPSHGPSECHTRASRLEPHIAITKPCLGSQWEADMQKTAKLRVLYDFSCGYS